VFLQHIGCDSFLLVILTHTEAQNRKLQKKKSINIRNALIPLQQVARGLHTPVHKRRLTFPMAALTPKTPLLGSLRDFPREGKTTAYRHDHTNKIGKKANNEITSAYYNHAQPSPTWLRSHLQRTATFSLSSRSVSCFSSPLMRP
jgi:hypothetical protein